MPNFQHSFPNPYKIARFYAKLAVRSLYDELSLYPKPGLVSFVDSGAHNDMDGLLFLRSLFCLRHYFFQIGLGALFNLSHHELVQKGKKAEQRMHYTTGGINTHRGAIFALGIFCTSASKLSGQYTSFSSHDLHLAILEDWADYLKNHHRNENTHGIVVKEKYAVADAKQLAIEGYALIFKLYHELTEEIDNKLFFGLMAYQRLLLNMDDINILYRTGLEGLFFARQQIQSLTFTNKEQTIQQAIKLHSLFSQNNISPGGVADMLSILYFLHSLFSQDKTVL